MAWWKGSAFFQAVQNPTFLFPMLCFIEREIGLCPLLKVFLYTSLSLMFYIQPPLNYILKEEWKFYLEDPVRLRDPEPYS